MKEINGYEAVIGLEIHIELDTKTKIFCGCSTKHGAQPNTQCCPVCMGFPGALPRLNKQALICAIKAGLAVNCEISEISKADRKNYFYPDLPKAYQISQFDVPLCSSGFLDISDGENKKRIGITRIHIEEDAGKLIHDPSLGTLIDCNRCGVPLIEVVTEPDITNAEQASEFVKTLRNVMKYSKVSKCRMNLGELRCDVNISVRKCGEKRLGTRAEIKNLNSFAFIQKAIEYEYARQVDLLESGGEVVQETRRFDELSGKTFSMRKKENLNDYRFFPEPDIPAFCVSKNEIDNLHCEIPTLPQKRIEKYITSYGISRCDAEIIASERFIADYFEKTVDMMKNEKAKNVANLLITEVLKYVSQDCEKIPLKVENLRETVELLECDVINISTAKKIIGIFCQDENLHESPSEYVKRMELEQINDNEELEKIVKAVLENCPKAVSDYKSGKSAAAKSLMGQIMARTRGRANSVSANKILLKYLDND